MSGDLEPAAPRTLVLFGAGAVGRGFIAELFCGAGWETVFVEADPVLLDRLAIDGSYRHTTVGSHERTRVVGPVRVIAADDFEGIAKAIAAAACLGTAVGARVLPRIAPVIAAGLVRRTEVGAGPIDLLLCENLHDASSAMAEFLAASAPADRAEEVLASVGLVETSIGRMIPSSPSGRRSPTDVFVEPYRFLPVDIAAARTPILQSIPGIVSDRGTDFAYYADRKLYIHNMGHFLCGLLASANGLESIADAIADPRIRLLTRSAMIESAIVLAAHHDAPLSPLVDHVDDLIHRFGNRALGDTAQRVCRDPERKAQPGDRVLGPLEMAVRQGSPHRMLLVLLAGAKRLLESVGSPTIRVDRVPLDEADLALVERLEAAFMDPSPLDALLRALESPFEEARIP